MKPSDMQMCRRFVPVLAAALAAACAAPVGAPDDAPPAPEPAALASAAPVVTAAPLPALRVYVDPGVTAADGVRAGVAGWAQATAGVRVWAFVDSADGADLAIYEIGPYARVCDSDQAETDALGCVREIGGLWDRAAGGDAVPLFLVAGNYERAAATTVMHEIGHALGLTHGAGLMAPDAHGAWTCPDAETIDRLSTKLHVYGLSACEAP